MGSCLSKSILAATAATCILIPGINAHHRHSSSHKIHHGHHGHHKPHKGHPAALKPLLSSFSSENVMDLGEQEVDNMTPHEIRKELLKARTTIQSLTTQLTQTTSLEEDFGTSNKDGSKASKPTPGNVSSTKAAWMSNVENGPMSHTTDFATLWKTPTWAEDVQAFGVCLENYEEYARNAVGCPDMATTGVTQYFAKQQYEGMVQLSLGYAPGMGRVGLIFEGSGANQFTDLMSPLVRYNIQEAKKQLGYHCAPPTSDCKSSLVETVAIDHQIGTRRDCPKLVLRMIDSPDVDPDHLSAMRGQATTISRAYKSNEENGDGSYFKGHDRDFGAAVAICHSIRYDGAGATEPRSISAQGMYDVPTEAERQNIPSLTSLEEVGGPTGMANSEKCNAALVAMADACTKPTAECGAALEAAMDAAAAKKNFAAAYAAYAAYKVCT